MFDVPHSERFPRAAPASGHPRSRLVLTILLVLPILPVGLCGGCADPSAAGPGSLGMLAAPRGEAPSTFSIVAREPGTGDLGAAVASRFLAVGSVVPWIEEGVGAVATQSYANTSYGPRGLALLREGLTPEDAVRRLVEADPERDFRQLGIVDARGRSHAFTGPRCVAWAGHRVGKGLSVQGNILVSEATLDAMVETFAMAEGELAERLLAALEAGDAAGGDARGRQSAALVVARKGGGYGGFNARYVDLRVDDHPDAVGELRRLLELQLGRDALSRARKLDHGGRREEAVEILEGAIRSHPGWEAARVELARLLLLSGQVARGKEVLGLVLAERPGDAQRHLEAARVFAEASQEADCLAEARRAVSLNREYAHALRREIESPSSPLGRFREKLEAVIAGAEGREP